MGSFTNAKPTGASGTGETFTSVSGSRATTNVGASAAIREVQEAMVVFEPYQTPLLSHFLSNKLAKKPTGNQKYEFMHSTLLPQTETVTLTGGGANEDAIAVGDKTLFQVGTKFVVDSTGEVLIVDSIAGNDIDVTKVGSGNITAAAGAGVHFLGESFEQGSSSATAKSVNKNFLYNYVEIFKKAVNETGSQQSTVEYGPNDWNFNKTSRMSEIKIQIEQSMWRGIRSSATGYQNQAYTQFFTGGVFDSTAGFISTTYAYAGTKPSETFFFDTLVPGIFGKGSNRKRLYAGANLIQAVNDYSKVKQQTKVEDTVYGVKIREIMTTFGTLELVWNPQFDGDTFASQGVVLDFGMGDMVQYRYLAGNGNNRDIQFRDYPHFAEQDSRKGEWLGEIGFQLKGDEYHSIVKPA